MKIIFLPDIILPNKVNKKNLLNLELFLSEITRKFKDYHFFVNLENVILSKNIKAKNSENINLPTSENIFKILPKFGIRNFSLSNNHIFDFGYEGFKQTSEVLKKNNVNFFGAGKNLSEASRPIIFNDHNHICSIFGMSYKPLASSKKAGIFNLKDNKSLNHIKKFKIKHKSSFIIVYCHSGLELFEYPLIRDEIIYKQLIDYGADLIIGSHPHRTQGIEKYKNKYIFYSIGDLFFENHSKKFWNSYISKPAHAHIYKNDINNKMLFDSYMLKIDTLKKSTNVFNVSRDLNFHYKYKKLNQVFFKNIYVNYKKKLNSKSNLK